MNTQHERTVYELIEANGLTLHGDIEHFAELVREDEREACAKICEAEGIGAKYQGDVYATAIRARS